ncbi:MAG: FMN-binding protein [Vicinamibacterales bacterium]
MNAAQRFRRALPVLALLLVPTVTVAQSRLDPLVPKADEAALRTLIPQADSFELVETSTRHFRAYAQPGSGGDPTLIGFAFFTTDVTPRLYAYKGRITMLVGMDTAGSLIDVQVVYHYEPFGYFSIDPPGFASQFRNKSILDPLEVGEDIDAVSRATITVTAATRAIRQGARLLARELLADQVSDK